MKKSAPSTSSAESEGSVWDLNGQAQLFGQLPSVSATHSPSESLKSTGLKSQSLTTSKNSEARNPHSQMELISSAAGSRDCANPGVLRGSVEAQKMTVTSGQRWLPLLKNYVQDSCLAKTCEVLLTSRWASNAASLTWKASGMKPSHLLFQLAPKMLPTDATGSGFWATPNTIEIGQMWPTPRAMEIDESVESWLKREKQRKDVGLPMFSKNLSMTVKMWPTPTTKGFGHASEGQTMIMRRKVETGELTEQEAQAMMNGTTLRPPRLKEWMWPTPTANEDAAGTPDGKMQKMLGNHPEVRGKTAEDWAKGSLNPQFVEWMMGYPEDWTKLDDTQDGKTESRKGCKE